MVMGPSKRRSVSDPQLRRLVVGAVAWSTVVSPLAMLISRPGHDTTALPAIEWLPRGGWLLVLAWLVPLLLVMVSWAWGQRSRTALVVSAALLDLAVVAPGPSPAVLFAPAAVALTVAALSRRD